MRSLSWKRFSSEALRLDSSLSLPLTLSEDPLRLEDEIESEQEELGLKADPKSLSSEDLADEDDEEVEFDLLLPMSMGRSLGPRSDTLLLLASSWPLVKSLP